MGWHHEWKASASWGLHRRSIDSDCTTNDLSRVTRCTTDSLADVVILKTRFLTFAIMQFSNPGALWFLAALIIPIIIHLFYFRRYKKVFFSDTRFLREAKEVQRNASRLKHLLVLFSRLLALAALIFAFAQPFISADSSDDVEANHISFFIDNSFSMEAGGTQNSLLEEAKRIAIESIRAYPDHYSFHVFDHGFASEDQQWIDKDKAINKINRTSLTGQVKTLSQIIGRQKQMRERVENGLTNTYVITDGQKNVFASIPDFDAEDRIQIVRLKPVVPSNLSLDSAWVDDPVILPGQASRLFVKVSNYSESNVEDIALNMTSNGQTRPAGSVDIAAGDHVIDTIPINFSSAGWKEIRLSVSDEGVAFDDELLLTLPISDRINILLINDNDHEAFFRAAVQGNQRTTFTRVPSQQVVYSDFSSYDLIVIDGITTMSSGMATEVKNYLLTGGNVLFFPSNNGDINSYNSFFNAVGANSFDQLKSEELSVLRVNTRSAIFKNVYRNTGRNLKTPTVKKYYSQKSRGSASKEVLLSLRNRTPYLTRYGVEGGNLYVSSAPSDENSSDILSRGSFLVPMLHRMSISSHRGIAPYYTIGQNQTMTISAVNTSNDPVYKLIGNTEVIPARYPRLKRVNLYAGEQIDQAGVYRLTTQDTTLALVAYNYDRSESDMTSLSNDEIEKLAPEHLSIISVQQNPDIAQAIVNKSTNKTYWKWLIIACLVFLLIEQLLLRHWKS